MARHSSRTVKLSVVPLLAASFLAGCGDEEEQAYCVDEDDQVVENRYCDDDTHTAAGGAFFWYFTGAGTKYGVGQKVTGGTKIASTDRAALAQRGGFGSSSSGEGVGRSFTRSGGG